MRRRDLLALALGLGDDPVWIVAHRGAMRQAPENTIAAFEAAARAGADFVELDVRETRDGQLVLMHDATVDRTTRGRGAVAELPRAEVDAPLFADALRWARRRGMRVDVDHKTGPVEAIARAVRDAGMTERVVIEGTRERLARLTELLPGVDTMPKVTSVDDVAVACRLLRTRVVRLSLAQLADPAYVQAVRAAGARVSVTILGEQDNEARMREVIARGARLIETDYPEIAARVRGQR